MQLNIDKRDDTMLDANIKAQLKAYLEKLQRPIELVASLDDSAKAQELRGLLVDIAGVDMLHRDGGTGGQGGIGRSGKSSHGQGGGRRKTAAGATHQHWVAGLRSPSMAVLAMKGGVFMKQKERG